ncbi:flavodoxin [Bifidobacterium castoris]|uniref:Flavodoxin n=2 Tax=Bifidobacterium castoris TaxID=2306972 RepID=A0A430F6D1_9BIFI|nr:flavodoxin [Bifidobacterium castoris]
MNWHKRLAACIVGAAVVTLTACGGGSGDTSATPAPSSTQTVAPMTGDTSTTLVAYFSATGSTKRVAEDIATATGGTLFAIEPAEAYTSDDLNYNDADSRVSKEHDDESLRDVKLKTTEVPDWDRYTTVYIGYPIWWGVAAWPVDTFVRANDFSGKTVIPFCTSASSPLGSSASELAKLANGGDWKDGQRFGPSADAADVKAWVKQQS